MAYARKCTRIQKKNNTFYSAGSSFFPVIVLNPVCFDGLELFLVYKLQYKEAAPDGNGVYFCSK